MFWQVLGTAALDWAQNQWQDRKNAGYAEGTRDWQEYMSNTSYTRAARDLQSAGLNRVLALGQGAVTPAGATAFVDKPRAVETGIMSATAKQQIDLQKAEEKLVGQKQEESQSAEDLNKVTAMTSATQGSLNMANAQSALQNARLLAEQARKVRLEADRGEVLNPIYQMAGDFSKWLEQFLRSSAKDDGKSGELKSFFNDVLHEVQTGEGVKNLFHSRTPNPEVIKAQKWPKFKRGGR